MIKLGYEIGTGAAVEIPLRHTAVTGQTQESGKTTTLEALIERSGLRAVAFITKRGEKSFRLSKPVPVYFSEPEIAPETPLWRWIESIFETVGESVGRDEKAAIIQASDCELEIEHYKVKGEARKRLHATARKVKTLEQVAANVEVMLSIARGKMQTGLTCLNAYFKIVIPQIRKLKASPQLELLPGINVMDLESLTDEMQMLVIRSVIEEVYRRRRKIVVIVPESAKFIPRARKSPVRLAAEMFIRQGLGIGNVLMLDSQDLANVATEVLKNVGVWILGKQNEINEVKRVVDYIPVNPKIPREAIMQLGKGQFFAVFSGQVKKVYVQPAGMENVHAEAIARGDESPDSWNAIVRRLETNRVLDNDEMPRLLQQEIREQDEAIEEMERELAENVYAEIDDVRKDSAAAGDAQPGDRAEPAVVSGSESSGTEDARQMENQTDYRALFERAQVEIAELKNKIKALGGALDSEYPGDTCPACGGSKDNRQLIHIAPGLNSVLCKLDTFHNSPCPSPAQNGKLNLEVKAIALNGNMAEFLRELRAHPEVIALLREQPEIRVKVARPVIDWDSSTVGGRIAKMFSEGFFSQPKTASNVVAELKRRGWPTPTTNVYKPLDKLAAMGFVTVESDGYLAVKGAKITTVNA